MGHRLELCAAKICAYCLIALLATSCDSAQAAKTRTTAATSATIADDAPSPSTEPPFKRSGDLGITHCVFQGMIGDNPPNPVSLHVWLKALHYGGGMFVRGLAFLTTKDPGGNGKHYHLQQPLYWNQWYGLLSLWSPDSRLRYRLNVSSITALDNPFYVSGNIQLSREDQRRGDFQLHAEGFDFFCNVYTRLQGNHLGVEPVEGKQPVYFLLSPVHHKNLAQLGTVVNKHIDWHAKLGVDQHILYMSERAATMLMEPVLQDNLARQKLQIVLWEDLSVHMTHGSINHHELYLYQELMYNHCLLALWGQNALAIMADLDEFVGTPVPMSIPEIFVTCGKKSGISSVTLLRSTTLCNSCNASDIEASSWDTPGFHINKYDTVPPDKGGAYNGRFFNCKTIVLVDDFVLETGIAGVHWAVNTPMTWVDGNCARFFHLANLWANRLDRSMTRFPFEFGSTGGQDLQQVSEDWLWPLPGQAGDETADQ